MAPAWYWILNHADRILSFIAIVIAAVAILEVQHLFRTTEERETLFIFTKKIISVD